MPRSTSLLPAWCAMTALLAASCATTGALGPDSDRRFYEARCGLCHVPWPRDSHAAGEWPRILDVMAPRAGLTSVQRERVLRYLSSSDGAGNVPNGAGR